MKNWIVPALAACLLIATCVHARATYVCTPQQAEEGECLPLISPDRQPIFGTYSKAYLDRQQLKKWKDLCKGGGRYQAMAEAYEARKPDPCNPKAREWQR